MGGVAEHKYYPENWKPLERWLPVSLCRSRFVWMWHEQGYECYRYRDSGELLHLDSLGQCWDLTELGPMPADFAQHFQRCTGQSYAEELSAAVRQDAEDLEDDYDDEEDDEDEVPCVQPPNGYSLSRILQAWAGEQQVDASKLGPLLSELTVFNALLFGEEEEQCKTLLKTTRCWLK